MAKRCFYQIQIWRSKEVFSYDNTLFFFFTGGGEEYYYNLLNMKLSTKIITVLTLILLIGTIIILFLPKENGTIFGGALNERSSYDIIGTVGTATTTNALYDGNSKVLVTSGFDQLHFDIKYLPKSWDSVIYILVEGSNDGGTTYFPVNYSSVSTTLNDYRLYANGASSTVGFPITFPGELVSVSGTTYYASYDKYINFDHVKVRVKESTTSTKGELYIRATLINN